MKTLITFAIIFACSAVLFAQERTLTKSEFDAVVVGSNAHHAKWKGQTYRMTVTTSAKQVGRPQTDWSSTMIFEYGPDSAIRTSTTSTFGENPVKTQETLRVGKWLYTRNGSDPWKRKEYAPSHAEKQNSEPTGETVKTNSEYKYLGTTKLMDKTAHVYLSTERRTKNDTKTGATRETDVRVTYWIDDDGMMLKNEYSAEAASTTGASKTLIVTAWERDPAIKFIEPDVVD